MFSLPEYFIPKSSTTSVNCTGLVACLKSPGVWGSSKYPSSANLLFNNLFAYMPDWGSPYIPRLILM